jgi:hypothetical protein
MLTGAIDLYVPVKTVISTSHLQTAKPVKCITNFLGALRDTDVSIITDYSAELIYWIVISALSEWWIRVTHPPLIG